MDVRMLGKQLSQLQLRRNLFLSMTIALLCIVMLETLVLVKSFNHTRVVVVPTDMKQVGWLDERTVSDSYLAEVSRYFSSLFLNWTPSNSQYQIEQILHYVSPQSHAKLKETLEAQAKDYQKKELSTRFSLIDVATDPTRLVAVVTGDMAFYMGSEQTAIKRVSYAIQYRYHNGVLWVVSFSEVEREKH